MKLAEAKSVLSSRGWLTKTPAQFRESILSNCALRSFGKGERIFSEGDDSAGLWGLATGTVGVEISGKQRAPTFAFFFGIGFWIGAHSLVFNSGRQVGLMAVQPSSLLYLSAAKFQDLTRQDPEAWRWLSVLPLLQQNVAFGVLDDLLIRDTRRQCAAILLRLAGCRGPFAVSEPDEIFVTQQQLSEMINISRTALGEVLRDFEKKGFIFRKYGKLKIVRDALEDVVNNG